MFAETIVVRPLKPNYKTQYISVTELEAFIQCPKKFKEVGRQDNKDMTFGRLVHEAMSFMLFNKEKNYDRMLEHYVMRVEDEQEAKRLGWALDIGYYEIPEIFMADRKYTLNIECGEYLIVMRGKPDFFHHPQKDEEVVVGDLKVSKYKWKEGSQYTKLQPYFYLWFYWSSLGVTTGLKEFKYHLVQKLKTKCNYQCLPMSVTLGRCELEIKKAVVKYVVALYHDKWHPKENFYCPGCPLYKEGQCELYNGILAKMSMSDEGTSTN